jgi:antitoxin (DNA-binding transcriptional repressor) of toxin-antitoxin stability system
MLYVTSTDFQNNVGKYLNQLSQGDLIITRNGVSVAKLTKPGPLDYPRAPTPITDSLYGIVKGASKVTLDEIRAGRLAKYNDGLS